MYESQTQPSRLNKIFECFLFSKMLISASWTHAGDVRLINKHLFLIESSALVVYIQKSSISSPLEYGIGAERLYEVIWRTVDHYEHRSRIRRSTQLLRSNLKQNARLDEAERGCGENFIPKTRSSAFRFLIYAITCLFANSHKHSALKR